MMTTAPLPILPLPKSGPLPVLSLPPDGPLAEGGGDAYSALLQMLLLGQPIPVGGGEPIVSSSGESILSAFASQAPTSSLPTTVCGDQQPDATLPMRPLPMPPLPAVANSPLFLNSPALLAETDIPIVTAPSAEGALSGLTCSLALTGESASAPALVAPAASAGAETPVMQASGPIMDFPESVARLLFDLGADLTVTSEPSVQPLTLIDIESNGRPVEIVLQSAVCDSPTVSATFAGGTAVPVPLTAATSDGGALPAEASAPVAEVAPFDVQDPSQQIPSVPARTPAEAPGDLRINPADQQPMKPKNGAIHLGAVASPDHLQPVEPTEPDTGTQSLPRGPIQPLSATGTETSGTEPVVGTQKAPLVIAPEGPLADTHRRVAVAESSARSVDGADTRSGSVHPDQVPPDAPVAPTQKTESPVLDTKPKVVRTSVTDATHGQARLPRASVASDATVTASGGAPSASRDEPLLATTRANTNTSLTSATAAFSADRVAVPQVPVTTPLATASVEVSPELQPSPSPTRFFVEQPVPQTVPSHIVVRLEPPDLGHIRIDLTSSASGIVGHLRLRSDTTRAAVERDIAQLHQALANAGVRMERLEIAGVTRPAETAWAGADDLAPRPASDRITAGRSSEQHPGDNPWRQDRQRRQRGSPFEQETPWARWTAAPYAVGVNVVA